MEHLPNSIQTALANAANALTGSSDSPLLDAEALLAWILGVTRSYLIAHPEKELTRQAALNLENAVVRRKAGEPLAYITGVKEFWSLPLKVTRDVLVPRPETELLVEKALQLIPMNGDCRVLDLGTGSGAVAIAIASERKHCEIVAVDASQEALDVARANAAMHGLANILFLHGRWTEPVSGQKFDIVVSNPPYIRDDDPALGILKYEPRSALAAGPGGLDAISTIAADAAGVMAANGILLLEHGADQKDPVQALLLENGWTEIRCFPDLAGHPRVTAARMDDPAKQDLP